MRLERLEQLKLGDLVKCICIDHRDINIPTKGFWLGIVYDVSDSGVVHVRYDDGDLCFYAEDEEVYNENIYLLKEEHARE